jgi:Uma2 family endonuclease
MARAAAADVPTVKLPAATGGRAVEALQLKTIDDLLTSPEERVELIDGEIVRRPMARLKHGVVQGNARTELSSFTRGSDPGGWWIATEVSVAYEPHQCPSHDLAGWRKQRLPSLPTGVVDLAPDWVCEIVSPGHERKDTVQLPLLLQRHRVPFYWLIWPEEGALAAHELEGNSYRVIAKVTEPGKVRIRPFAEIELDVGFILGLTE